MANDFDLERFTQNLIETVIWCRHQIEAADMQTVVWPLTGDDDTLWTMTKEQFPPFCDRIIADRAQQVKTLARPDDEQLMPLIQQGRLMVFYPGITTSDGLITIESRGYFGRTDYPPWDTWVYYWDEPERKRLRHLIAWVAPDDIDDVDNAIQASADECVVWLTASWAEIPYADVLKAAHLWI